MIRLSKNLFISFYKGFGRSSKDIEWKFNFKVIKENRNKVAILLLYFFYFHLPDQNGCGCKIHRTLLIIFRHYSGTELNTRKVYTKFPRRYFALPASRNVRVSQSQLQTKRFWETNTLFLLCCFPILTRKVFKPLWLYIFFWNKNKS